MFCLFSEHLESVPHFSSILSRNAYKALVKYCQFDLVISLGFVYVHNPERSLRVSTEEQIITACVCKFIRVLFWNFSSAAAGLLRSEKRKYPPTN